MKKRYITATLLAGMLAINSCSVLNPNVTEDVFLENSNAASSWVNGLRKQLALTMNQVVVSTELVSDNYYNNRTLSSKVFDIPQIDYYDVDVNNLQVHVNRLREMANYGLQKVLKADPAATAADSAEVYFSSAFASLLSGELFVALPGSTNGAVLSPTEHLQIAIRQLDQAIALTKNAADISAFTLLKSRAYYALGDAANAAKFAAAAQSNNTLLRQVKYDGVNNVPNDMQTYLFSSTYNEFAPLPRLDFLDPKYFHTGQPANDQKPVTIVKAEEAWLILAETQIAAGNPAEARNTLKQLLSIVANRPFVMLDDKKDTRNGGNRNDYPTTAVQVKFDASDAARDNYVLDRQKGNVKVYTVSGTMVTNNDLDAAITEDQLLYTLYRLRQEIFIAEGRRMTDLGIKFPVSQTEQLSNPNVKPEHLKAQLPAFIPLGRGMDDFTYDKANGIVTMKYDMNAVLVKNKHAKEIFPFIN
ncbi:tetratricopeptide repeat protein [Chitinophaga qingshengii]|uniref:Tetratricopeptide repeat protein n=1 Tax=Chitinophaga qingshengii TaxID=1569794 RepID=A0ABR7TZ40_9BACT|nr:tetratricopeptide repeat protein [Chitinophaga qingshengii]MBC9934871.1 tetratricopeptide repeat protein [Chitinophaga qingshengii]